MVGIIKTNVFHRKVAASPNFLLNSREKDLLPRSPVDEGGLAGREGAHDAQPKVRHRPRQRPFLRVHERIYKREHSTDENEQKNIIILL